MTDPAPTMGERLRQLRCMAGIEQEELAAVLGYERASGVSNLERGRRKIRGEHLDAASAFFAEQLGETKEEIINFLHGLRRFTFSPTPDAYPVIEGEARDAKRATRRSRTASRAANGYIPLRASEQAA